MESLNQAADSDDYDKHLFQNTHLARQVISIKHDDPKVKSLELFSGHDVSRRQWKRLGEILGKNTTVEKLGIQAWNIDIPGFCAGLQNNRKIEKLWLCNVDLEETGKMQSFTPFLSDNPSLKAVSLICCNIGPGSMNILSEALLNRSENTLRELSLSECNLGDIDLEKFVLALINKNRSIVKLWLAHNGIGRTGCASLANMLGNNKLSLASLNLDENLIDDESALILAKSLKKNDKLKSLSLHSKNHDVTKVGWSAMLKLVCDTSSLSNVFASNHTLHDLGMQLLACDRETVDDALGADNGNLLRASLELNRSSDKTMVARCKIIWSHARGDFNIGNSSIAAGAYPRVLAWIGNCLNEDNNNIIQYHEPPLSKAAVDTIRLNAMYRIITSRPELCMPNTLKMRPDDQMDREWGQDEVLKVRNEFESITFFFMMWVMLSISLVIFGIVSMQSYRL
mmetsp:Transcript_3627/g.6813  ORF Transcript_3627/g.6813 Transcript_3627/m.6813 type:complete len:454 (+) Transcript_3627:76-1437(+)